LHRLIFSWKKENCAVSSKVYVITFVQIIKHLVSNATNIKQWMVNLLLTGSSQYFLIDIFTKRFTIPYIPQNNIFSKISHNVIFITSVTIQNGVFLFSHAKLVVKTRCEPFRVSPDQSRSIDSHRFG
jgi:hypothetical protein